MASVASTRGYILEEVLAKLIKNAGYDLIAHSSEPENLKRGAHGLQVRGRGAWHQVDALGQFRWTPPFNFPIRLFLEAKFRAARIGVDLVRQAIGITSDINQRINAIEAAPGSAPVVPVMAYRYSYALASSAGFTREAASLGLAHQMSLIDLRVPEYNALLKRIDELAKVAVHMWQTKGGADLAGRLNSLRHNLRMRFHTAPPGDLEGDIHSAIVDQRGLSKEILDAQANFGDALHSLSEAVDDVSELFLGTANGPFFLLLKADNADRFLAYARAHRRHSVHIGWRGEISAGQIWEIRPHGPDDQSYRLIFALPTIIADWILAQDEPNRRAARVAKANFLSRICIYRSTENQADELFQLEYEPESVRQGRSGR